MNLSCAVRAVCVFSRAHLRVDVSCACVIVACARSQSCVALTYCVRSRKHVRAQPSRVCVHERACAAVVCARSRACVCIDVSCACAPCAC